MRVYVHTWVYSYVGQAVQSGRAGELLNRVTGVRKREGRLESVSYRVEMIPSFVEIIPFVQGKFSRRAPRILIYVEAMQEWINTYSRGDNSYSR